MKSDFDANRLAPRIGSRSAAAAWLLGTALLGAGAVAVFITANAAGSVALIGAGTAFILIAAWRHLPSSIKAGGYELIWATAYETGRQQVVDDLNKTIEKGEDVQVELARIEKEYKLAENEQRLRILTLALDRGFINDADAELLRKGLIDLRPDGPGSSDGRPS
jgi:hypothetical protein